MKINYNIADNRKVNYVKFALIAGSLAVVSLLFILVGLNQLSDTAQQFQEEKEELQSYKDKISDITKREEEQKQAIKRIKTKWGKKRRFLNSLIDSKVFPYIPKLDKMEELMPAGVFIQTISLSTRAKDTVQLTIAAISATRLVEAFKTFQAYDAVFKNETQSDGLYKAVVTITVRNKPKNETK
ncbi:MAG: hypothetical protein GY940_00245 [bacterium]|nr:hypothetical protein [bacterium]